jgi:hypothetical protein
LRPGTRMKQASPVHFVAGFLKAIAPDAQRMRRQTERCGIFRMPHAAEVHRLHMHAPERLKSHRTAVRAHAVAIAPRPPLALRRLLLVLPFRRFLGQISLMFWHVCADRPRSADGAPTASNWSSKDRVSGSTAPLPARFDTRLQHGSTRTDCWRLPRNGAVPSKILRCNRRTRELEMKREQNIRKTCRARTLTDARRAGSECKIKRDASLPSLRS